MFRGDLRKNVVSKGAEIQVLFLGLYFFKLYRHTASQSIFFFQGTVIDLRNPGMFSIHLQSIEMIESLKNITAELQKAYSTSFAPEYKPEIGELCAVKFSLDRVRQIITF